MCGIAGIYNVRSKKPADSSVVEKMIGALGHRGPDETGFHVEGELGLGQCRLSIIDLSGGRQPIYNEDRSLCVVFNGEIFNYIELRKILETRGHVFSTHTDTEVLVHLYEEYGKDFLSHCIGQFGIALFDKKKQGAYYSEGPCRNTACFLYRTSGRGICFWFRNEGNLLPSGS